MNKLLTHWKSQGHTAYGFTCNVNDISQREDLINKVKNKFGSLDVLVNNVGPNFKKFIFDYSLDEYQQLIDNNMKPTFHITKLCYPLLKKSTQPSIINVSSVSSSLAFKVLDPLEWPKLA